MDLKTGTPIYWVYHFKILAHEDFCIYAISESDAMEQLKGLFGDPAKDLKPFRRSRF